MYHGTIGTRVPGTGYRYRCHGTIGTVVPIGTIGTVVPIGTIGTVVPIGAIGTWYYGTRVRTMVHVYCTQWYLLVPWYQWYGRHRCRVGTVVYRDVVYADNAHGFPRWLHLSACTSSRFEIMFYLYVP
jgi:hypothetical protein